MRAMNEDMTQAWIAAKLLPEYAEEVRALAALEAAGMLASVKFEYRESEAMPLTGRPEPNRDGTITWRALCPRCLYPSQVRKLDPFAVNAWRNGGMHVQEAFPHLSAAERETLTSGLHDECFELWFAPVTTDG
jgi:hypothetical protein